MSAVGNLWLAEYERVPDDYTANVERYGEEAADEMARTALRSLGLDPIKVEDTMSEIKS